MSAIQPSGISDFGFRISDFRRGEAGGLIEAGYPRLGGFGILRIHPAVFIDSRFPRAFARFFCL